MIPQTVATRLLCPWDSPGKDIRVGCHTCLQGIFPTRGSNPGLLYCRWILYHLSHQGSPLLILFTYYDDNFYKYLQMHWCICIYMLKIQLVAETLILWPPHAKSWLIWKDPDAGKDWGQEGKGMTEGWDGWMTSPTQRTWVWVNSGSWWWTGRPGVLRFMGSQRVGHNWVTGLNWTEGKNWWLSCIYIRG